MMKITFLAKPFFMTQNIYLHVYPWYSDAVRFAREVCSNQACLISMTTNQGKFQLSTACVRQGVTVVKLMGS